MKATKQYFPVVLFIIMLYRVVTQMKAIERFLLSCFFIRYFANWKEAWNTSRLILEVILPSLEL